jgi:pimeloyl-ACP methyl ester carboxylesterase
VLCACAVTAIAFLAFAGHHLSRARPSFVGEPPTALRAETVELVAGDGVRLRAWFIRGERGRGAMLLLHGLGGSRRQLLARAAWLRSRGASSLLYDARGHGESDAVRTSFGLREAGDAAVALRALRARCPGERCAAIGISLGAAALLFASGDLDLDAQVLEAPYARLEDATADRLEVHFGAWTRPLAALLTRQSRWWIGASAEELRPIDRAPAIRVPTLFLTGGRDGHAPIHAVREIASRAPAGLASLEVFEGADHGDLHAFEAARYERLVFEFLEQHVVAVPPKR